LIEGEEIGSITAYIKRIEVFPEGPIIVVLDLQREVSTWKSSDPDMNAPIAAETSSKGYIYIDHPEMELDKIYVNRIYASLLLAKVQDTKVMFRLRTKTSSLHTRIGRNINWYIKLL
ncbi:MAG: hypothetical protein JEY91_18435, partial [Spirochaetaceae bacterium]|nr:hypothetical protein [Spirochaetaceae bacterium]